MAISQALRKASRSLFPSSEENGSFRLPKTLEVIIGTVVLLELTASITSTSYGLDSRHHLNWISQFTKLVSDGVLIPRWVPDGFSGFGAASFYFYPPITFYLASFVSTVTTITSAVVLFQVVSLLATIGSFFAARIFLRSIGSERYQATLGAILYTIAPFRLAELYHRGALPTHIAYVFIPLVWLGLIAIFRQETMTRSNRIMLLGISSAMLALTNVPVALVTIVCIGIAAIVVWRNIRWELLFESALAAILATAISAFHFAAVIAAHPYTQIDETISIHPPLGLSSIFKDINWFYVYHLIFVYAPVVIIGLAYWKITNSDRTAPHSESITIRIGLVMLFVIVFLNLLPLSRTLWNELLPLQLIQFGMRFFSHLLLFVCIVIGLARSVMMKRTAVVCTWLLAIGALAPAILVVFNLHLFPHYSAPPEDSPEYRPIYTVAVDTFMQTMKQHEADPAALTANFQSGESVQPEAILPGSTDNRSSFEKFDIMVNSSRAVTFHRFYWPYWHLYIDDRSSMTPAKEIISHPDSIGRAVAILPAGHYTAHWQLEKTPLELAGLWISGFAWAGLITFSGIGLVRRSVRKKLRAPKTDVH